jgi:hypothetical protein
MRCRYCGKELALFKRLTGGGEFCSDAHKQSYQEEYNRLALSRLLQAQKISQAESSSKKPGTPAPARVAVAEPAPEDTSFEKNRPEERADTSQVMETAPLEISNLGESLAEEEVVPDAPPETEPEPLEMAEFLSDIPGISAWPDETPYLEPWLELSSGPAVADREFQNGTFALSTADLLSLDLPPNASPAEHSVAHPATEPNLTPQQIILGPDQPTLPKQEAAVRPLPSSGALNIEVAAAALDFALDRSIAPELGFETAILLEDSPLLDLPATEIEFPAEDSGVIVAVGPDSGVATVVNPAEAPAAEEAEDDSPRASLEALSRLHQDLVEQEQTHEPQPQVEPAAPAESAVPAEEPTPAAATEEAPAGEPTPGRATELIEVAIRIFPPAKLAPMAGTGLPSQSEPLLPNLKSLPLRPKVAVASGYVPPSTAPGQHKGAASTPQAASPQAAAKDTRFTAPSKSAPATAKPASRIAQPKQPAAPAKATGSAKAPEPIRAEPSKLDASKPAGKSQTPSQPAASKTAPPAQVRPESRIGKPDAKEAAGNPPAPATTAPAAKDTPPGAANLKPGGQPARPAVEEKAKDTAKPAAKPPEQQTPAEPAEDTVPSFGVQLASTSFAGSLKVKLGIGIAIIVVACSTWLGWGNRSRKPTGANAVISADGSGPSIIMGEGGWVEGWGGDPTGIHAGRQITIYRPSLKLSDYRIEFQGSIETQSIGWVFRAADPENYYAMKLMAVSSGLSPKVALFKYLVINGRQTQVGRVPIDLPVQADTVFNIRTDVRGPQFSTFIQGRQVDVWTDDQLKAGGVGFLNEREERGKVKSVSIRYLNAAAK